MGDVRLSSETMAASKRLYTVRLTDTQLLTLCRNGSDICGVTLLNRWGHFSPKHVYYDGQKSWFKSFGASAIYFIRTQKSRKKGIEMTKVFVKEMKNGNKTR